MMNSNYFPSSKLLFIIISKYNIYLIIIPSKLIFSFLHLFLYSNIITFLTIYPFYKNSTLQNKNFKMPIFLKNHAKGSRRKERFPTKPRSRSVPDVAVLNSQPLSGLLIKCQRLPRGFFWNRIHSGASLSHWLVCKVQWRVL